ncbi:hypothetical protein JMJ77_0001751, partial [Colletotrichum scovillei]
VHSTLALGWTLNGCWLPRRYLEGGTTANELFGTRRPPEFLVFDCDAVPQPEPMWQASIFRHDSSFESGRSLDNQRVMGLEKSKCSTDELRAATNMFPVTWIEWIRVVKKNTKAPGCGRAHSRLLPLCLRIAKQRTIETLQTLQGAEPRGGCSLPAESAIP